MYICYKNNDVEMAMNAEMQAINIYGINSTVSHWPRSVYCYLWMSNLFATKISLKPLTCPYSLRRSSDQSVVNLLN